MAKQKSEQVALAERLVEQIVDTIETEVADRVKSSHADFFESVEERAKSIGESVVANNWMTEKQEAALENMLKAVRKWVR